MTVGIRKRKKNKGFSYTVYIDYGIVNGKREKTSLETFSNSKEAENYKAKVQTEINNNTFVTIPNITFSEAIDEWMNNYVANNCEPNTASSYELINKKYLKPILGHIPFKIISSPEGIDIINDYYKYLRFELENETDSKTNKQKKNLSYSSVAHHKAQISGILTYFVNTKRLQINICLNTSIPKSEDEKMKDIVIDDIENFEDDELYEENEFLTPEQAVQILNLFINTDMMLPVFLATLLGLRRSEVAGILKDKINKENQTVKINASRVRCGNSTIYKKRNKNKTSTRFLYIPSLLMEVLKLDEKRQEKNRMIFGEKYIYSKFLCVMDNGQPLKVNYISEKFKKVFDKFIIQETKKAQKENKDFNFPYVTLHKLRHLNISALLANGAYITDVQANAGHSNINTTIHYTHNYTQGKKEIANKVDEIYAPLINNIKTS